MAKSQLSDDLQVLLGCITFGQLDQIEETFFEETYDFLRFGPANLRGEELQKEIELRWRRALLELKENAAYL